MHFCINELLVLSVLLNAVQAVGLVHFHHLTKEARRVARKLKRKLTERPVRTVVYANGEQYEPE
jgi:hypothetical protein